MNTTEPNTSGVADRVGATSGNTAGARDMNRGTATDRSTPTEADRNIADRRASANDIDRGTPTDRASNDMKRGTGNPLDRRSSDVASNSTRDMALSSGSPADTQASNRGASSIGEVANSGNRGNWDRSCFISPTTSSYALQLQDGRTLKIDEAANAKISSQLQSAGRVSTKSKVFRVKVTGSVNGDTIRINDIQM